ncbi:hypothetical protein [Kitasatospora sp. NPDC050543]|uniref:hypothetical protein n=1 Tax=Kitasatospora sp. NPDC050543 TaxID=3364054 RepID=UPI00379BA697
MRGNVGVSRLRVSYVDTRIHEKVRDIGLPGAFVSRLHHPEPVRDLPVTLPFEMPGRREDREDDVEWRFWSAVTGDGRLRPPASRPEADKLFQSRVPLRHQAVLTSALDTPRLEAFLHPFGWVLLATADVIWQRPVSLEEAAIALDSLQEDPAEVTLGGAQHPATLATATAKAAEALSQRLADDDPWARLPAYRLVSVIDGKIDVAPTNLMPQRNSVVHQTLHQLSCGGPVLTKPQDCFVARYDSSGYFNWDTSDLVYMLDRGAAVVLQQAVAWRPSAKAESTSGRHRRLALLLTYLSANAGLVRSKSRDGVLRDWAKDCASRLARLYGPEEAAADYWGLEARSYMCRTGAIDAIESTRGASLHEKHQSPRRYP